MCSDLLISRSSVMADSALLDLVTKEPGPLARKTQVATNRGNLRCQALDLPLLNLQLVWHVLHSKPLGPSSLDQPGFRSLPRTHLHQQGLELSEAKRFSRLTTGR